LCAERKSIENFKQTVKSVAKMLGDVNSAVQNEFVVPAAPVDEPPAKKPRTDFAEAHTRSDADTHTLPYEAENTKIAFG